MRSKQFLALVVCAALFAMPSFAQSTADLTALEGLAPVSVLPLTTEGVAADQILTDTEGPGGGFLDDGSGFGLYSRLNLYAAAARASVVINLASGFSRERGF